MELQQGQELAAAVIKALSPYCKKGKIEVVGSIRRKKPMVNDLDIVLIPSDLWALHAELIKLGRVKMSGAKIVRVMIGIRQVDIYVADEESWAMTLLVRTGSEAHNRQMAMRAKELGLHFAADGRGILRDGNPVAWRSEEEIFEALRLAYKEPWTRE